MTRDRIVDTAPSQRAHCEATHEVDRRDTCATGVTVAGGMHPTATAQRHEALDLSRGIEPERPKQD